MARRKISFRAAFLAGGMAWPAMAADVTPDRLVNADREPQNWLMNHRTYDAQRFSPLDPHQPGQCEEPQARLCGGDRRHLGQRKSAGDAAGGGRLPLHRRRCGVWSTRSTARSGDVGRIVWRMDPEAGKTSADQPRRGAVGQFRHHAPPTIRRASSRPTRRPARSSGKPTGGRQPDVQLTAAPLVVKDKIIVGAAGGDRGVRDYIAGARCGDRQAGVAQIRHSGARRARSETWKDKNNAWQTGGGAMWVTGTYDVATNQMFWGTGNPVPMFDPTYRPGDNLYTNSVISWDPDIRQDELVFPVHAGRPLGLRRGRHPHPDRRPSRRPAAQADHPFGAQRLSLHHGARQRAHGAGQALYRPR